MKKPELLAPAGDMSCMMTAVENGADAVYFGIKSMNMREGAGNFEISSLKSVMEYLHSNNVKGYLTLNTIYFNSELEKVRTAVYAAKEAGVDAVICWDAAVAAMAKDAGLEIHLSTQSGCANYEAFKFYASLGVKRIVIARECSLADIKEIIRRAVCDGIDCTVEAFIHGAMCVSVSGRCFLSEASFGKSANRGRCVQPCRREYRIYDVEDESNSFILGSDYVLSPKDLCTIEILPELIEAGIGSFKIEGRIRPPDYVKTTVSCYRRAIDAYFDGTYSEEYAAELKEELSKVYNRGFSEGFYKGLKSGWTSRGPQSGEKKEYVGEAVNYYAKAGAAEFAVRSGVLNKGDRLLVYGKTTPAGYFTADEIQIEHVPVESVSKGENCGIKIPFAVRPKDKLFKIVSGDY